MKQSICDGGYQKHFVFNFILFHVGQVYKVSLTTYVLFRTELTLTFKLPFKYNNSKKNTPFTWSKTGSRLDDICLDRDSEDAPIYAGHSLFNITNCLIL